MSSQQPYQNVPSGTPPPPGSGYTYYPDQGAQGYAQPGPGYASPAGYAQPQPPYPSAGYAAPDPRKGQAITGFIVGLIGLILLFLSWIPVLGFINLVLLILGVIFSALGMKSTTSRGLAIAGLVLSIIGLVIVGIILIGVLAALSAYHAATGY